MAAAVEQDDGLAAGGEAVVQFVFEDAAKKVGALSFEHFSLHVDDADAGQWQIEDATGQLYVMVVSFGLAVVEGFEAGGGRAEDNGYVVDLGAFNGDVAAMIARSVVLFVAGLVLFVDDDDAEAGQGRENR